MIILIAALLGALLGGYRAKRRDGQLLDILQYGAVYAMIFALIALFFTIFITRA